MVLTTRELIQMLRSAGINLAELPDEEFDNPMGYASGAGIVFGSGGGVLEGVMRTVYEKMTGKKLQTPAFKEVRTLEKIREAEIDIGGRLLKCATVRTTGETRRLIDKLKRGEAHYDFVEVMACPGGCVGGGGQPVYPGLDQWDQQLKQRYKRADALFEQDNLKNTGQPMITRGLKNYTKNSSANPTVKCPKNLFIHLIQKYLCTIWKAPLPV